MQLKTNHISFGSTKFY